MTVCAIIPALWPEGTVNVVRAIAADVDAVVVVDNAGGAVSAALADHAPWVDTIQTQQNLGFGRAVNLAARRSTAELLVVLNDDVDPLPGFVPHIVAPFADPQVHQVACCLLCAASSSLEIDSVGIAFDRTLRAENVRTLMACRTGIVGPSGAAAAYRRATFLDAGGFADELFAYWEDADLALRLLRAGHGCAFAADAKAYHSRGTALGGRSARQRELDAFGRGFVLGRYRAWLGRVDRLLVPLVDWPSVGRGCLKTRSLAPLVARREGHRAGRRTPIGPAPHVRPATRSVLRTLAGQFDERLPNRWPLR